MPDVKAVVTREELDQILEKAKKANQLVCIDFWAPWCGPCRMMTPVIEELSTRWHGKIVFLKIDVDKSEALSQMYGVRAMPTFVIIRSCEKIDELIGAAKEKLETMIEKHFRAMPKFE